MMVKCEYTNCGVETPITAFTRIHHWPCCGREIMDIALHKTISENLEAAAKPVEKPKAKPKPKAKAPAKKKAAKKGKGKK